jgi:hypothetical protein
MSRAGDFTFNGATIKRFSQKNSTFAFLTIQPGLNAVVEASIVLIFNVLARQVLANWHNRFPLCSV